MIETLSKAADLEWFAAFAIYWSGASIVAVEDLSTRTYSAPTSILNNSAAFFHKIISLRSSGKSSCSMKLR